MIIRPSLLIVLLAALAGCAPSFSPNTYNTSAMQQSNKVEQGVVVGVRDISVSATGATGAVTGAAAGGIVGSQAGTGGMAAALGAVGGSLIGGLAGAAVEHVATDTKAYEYIVRKTNADMVSVTQKDEKPLAIGQKVLVIGGSQARIVADYTVPVGPTPTEKAADKAKDAAPATPKPDAVAATSLALPAASTDPAARPSSSATAAPVTPDPAAPSSPAPAATVPTALPDSAKASVAASPAPWAVPAVAKPISSSLAAGQPATPGAAPTP